MTTADPYAEPGSAPEANTGTGPGTETNPAGGTAPEQTRSILDRMARWWPTAAGVPRTGAAAHRSADAGYVARPTAISSGLALGAGVLAVLLVATAPAQVSALGLTLGGTVGLVAGRELVARGYRRGGIALGLGGTLVVAAGLAWAINGTETVDDRIEVLPGLLGLAVLGAGVGAAPRGYERWFVSVGTAALLVTVIVSGMVEDAPVWALFAATAATYVAWDCGEQAINMAEQVGRQARTWEVELVHGSVAMVVALVGVVVALGFAAASMGSLPLLALTALLVGAIALAAGLFL